MSEVGEKRAAQQVRGQSSEETAFKHKRRQEAPDWQAQLPSGRARVGNPEESSREKAVPAPSPQSGA